MVQQEANSELNQQAASRALTSLIAVNFAGSPGYTVVMPFLVFLVLQWGGDAIVYSLVLASYPIFQLFGSPVLGNGLTFTVAEGEYSCLKMLLSRPAC